MSSLNCGNCGKQGNTLKKCTACKSVYYCGKACQRKAWPCHKKECKEIQAGSGGEKKWKPTTECAICMVPLPMTGGGTEYYPCCGKIICAGCAMQHMEEALKTTGYPPPCAFCRTPFARSDAEVFARCQQRIASNNDPNAIFSVALHYQRGDGVQQDKRKAFELAERAAKLGHPLAAHVTGNHFEFGMNGAPKDLKKARRYHGIAAAAGATDARFSLAKLDEADGDYPSALKSYKIAASEGHPTAMDKLEAFVRIGALAQEEYQAIWKEYETSKASNEGGARGKAKAMIRGNPRETVAALMKQYHERDSH